MSTETIEKSLVPSPVAPTVETKAVGSFGDAQIVTTANVKMGMTGERLMVISEFKKARGVKGTEAKKQFIQYLLDNGKTANGELSGALARGELLTVGKKCWKSGVMQVKFVKAASLVMPVEAPAKPVEIKDVWGGMTQADKDAFIAQYVQKAA